MAFCQKCGAQFEDGTPNCPACGEPVAAQNTAANSFQNLNNTADTTAQFDQADIEQNKAMAILSYIGILVLIPIFAAKNSKFAKFHANQGLVLFLAEVVISFALGIISGILTVIFWIFGVLFGLITGLVSLVFLVFMILGIVNAAQGKAKELPIIGKFTILK